MDEKMVGLLVRFDVNRVLGIWHDSKSVLVHRDFRGSGVGFSVTAARTGVVMAEILSTAKTGGRKKCDLRMRGRIDRRGADSITGAVFSLNAHFFYFPPGRALSCAL